MTPFTSGARLLRSPISMLPARQEEIHRATTRTWGTASTVPGSASDGAGSRFRGLRRQNGRGRATG